MSTEHPPIAVTVVNYGSHRLLREHLPAAVEPAGALIVVVDNYSTGAERAAMVALAAERGWELVALPDNGGFARGVNAGAARARELGASAVLLLNPDARVSAQVVAELDAHLQRDPKAIVTPRIVDSTGAVVFDGSELDARTGRLARRAGPHAVPWLTAACLAVPLDLFDQLGGMDESYFLYWEDVDFSYRALTAGAQLVVREDLVAVHDEGGTQQRSGRAKSPGYYRYNARNRLLFAARNLARADVVGWLVHTPVESTQILLRGGRRQLIESPRPLLAILRGSLEGIALALWALVRGRTGPRR